MKTLTMLWLALLLIVAQPVYAREIIDTTSFDVAWEQLSKPRYYEVSVLVTAYSIGDDNTPGTIMASGKQCYVGAVAMNSVPLGTKVVIDGKEYTVEDRMKYDGYVDIYMDSREAAMDWGVQRKTVKVEE